MQRPPPTPAPSRALLLATSFICGANIMVQELLGFRVLAPHFGYSIYVWGNLLGLILGALAIGYYLGGKLADRRPEESVLYGAILAASAYLIAMLFIYTPVMARLLALGPVKGSFAATILIYGPPMVLLSMVSPFVIKLLSDHRAVGAVSGEVYGISTLGSLFGVFAAAFWLIPTLGAHKTMAYSAAASLVLGIAGLARSRRTVLAGLILAPVALTSARTAVPGTIFEKDSPYFHIGVVRQGDRVIFRRDGQRASEYREGRLLTGDYWDLFMLGSALTRAENILILGMGTGTTLRQYLEFFPAARVEAVELDAEVVGVSHRYFGVPENDPRLTIRVDDARTFIMKDGPRYDFVEIDVYREPLQVPFYLTTTEFFSAVRRRTADDGMVMMNVAWGPYTQYMNRLCATIGASFPSIYAVRSGGNTLLLAAAAPIAPEELRRRIDKLRIQGLEGVLGKIDRFVPYAVPPGTTLLTDDLAPVEQLGHLALYKNQ